MSAETCLQVGCFARALFVRQTPPPAAPTNSVQSPLFLQLPIVTAVSRPDHCVGLMNDCVPNLSTLSVLGPRDSQYLAMNPGPFFSAFPAALIAPWTLLIVTSDAGYARSAYSWAASPPSCSRAPSSFGVWTFPNMT